MVECYIVEFAIAGVRLHPGRGELLDKTLALGLTDELDRLAIPYRIQSGGLTSGGVFDFRGNYITKDQLKKR